MKETSSYPFEVQDVAVAIIVRGEFILAVYNSEWEEFALPATKRRSWQDPNVPKGVRTESWATAAARAAAEWLDRTCLLEPTPVVEIEGFQQSDRDGVWRRYNLKGFKITLSETDTIPENKVVEWLTVEQFLDESRHPISETGRRLVAMLKDNHSIRGR